MKPPQAKLVLLASALLAAVQLAVYVPSLQNAFVKYDDDIYVFENKNIQVLNAETVSWMFARPYYRSYTPLALVSHAIDWKIWGNNPWGHHLTSLLLHAVNGILMFVLGVIVLSVLGSRPSAGKHTPFQILSTANMSVVAGSFVAALLWALHPMRVESVAWVSDRKDLLVALFLLLCIISYVHYDAVRGTPRALRWFLISFGFFVLAALSKSIAVVAPVVLVVLDWLLLHRGIYKKGSRGLLLEKIPPLIISIACGVLSSMAAAGSQTSDIVMRMSSLQRALMPFYSVMFYPVKVVAPFRLTPTYAPVGSEWMALSLLAALVVTIAVVRRAKNGRAGLLLAWLCYLLTILPTVIGLSAGIQPWADRYSYVPSISLVMVLGGVVVWCWERFGKTRYRLGVVTAGVVVAVMLSVLTREQIAIWKDGEALWTHAVTISPGLPMPYANLAVAVAARGSNDEAINLYRKALAIEPRYADALYNMGLAFEQKGTVDSAVHYYQKAILADTTYTDAFVNLGNVNVNNGRVDEGIALYARASQLDPSDPDPYYNSGYAYYQKGDRQAALEFFQKAIRYSPNYAQAYYNMGIVFSDLNKQDAALENLIRAARLGWPEAQRLLSSHGYSW